MTPPTADTLRAACAAAGLPGLTVEAFRDDTPGVWWVRGPGVWLEVSAVGARPYGQRIYAQPLADALNEARRRMEAARADHVSKATAISAAMGE